MVIIYDINTKEILYTEKETMIPKLPIGTTREKVDILLEENKAFIGLPYEMNEEIFDYKVSLDINNNFIGLQPKEKEVIL